MAEVRIMNLEKANTAFRRLNFKAAIYADSASDIRIGELGWRARVTFLERVGERSRVLTDDGVTGWVDSENVVEVMWIGRTEESYAARHYINETGEARNQDLLWGDQALVIKRGEARSKVWARGEFGWVENKRLDGESLLEVYLIDVGQGDGVLICTPDRQHVMIDGGWPRANQPTRTSGADFVDWKFFKDYGEPRVRLEAMIASHCDADHYGGLWDLLRTDAESKERLDCRGVELGAFYHAGVSWWQHASKSRWLGEQFPKDARAAKRHLIQLLGNGDAVRNALPENNPPSVNETLQGEWAEFLSTVTKQTDAISRIGVSAGSTQEVFLPKFGPTDESPATIRVLGPVFHQIEGKDALRNLGKDSNNTNGHSVLLRLDYKKARILLTGDLNRKSMQDLLKEYRGREEVLACDVAKACHHGSDDVSLAFLHSVKAAATVISSGDAAGHGHPRPAVVAASGLTGFVNIDRKKDALITPLVFSTEVEREPSLGRSSWIDAQRYPARDGLMDLRFYARRPDLLPRKVQRDAEAKRSVSAQLHYTETKSGARNASAGSRRFTGSFVVAGLTYGLVNVRTDGEKILCATMNAIERGWNIHVFNARF